jgi:hypothetical protein
VASALDPLQSPSGVSHPMARAVIVKQVHKRGRRGFGHRSRQGHLTRREAQNVRSPSASVRLFLSIIIYKRGEFTDLPRLRRSCALSDRLVAQIHVRYLYW